MTDTEHRVALLAQSRGNREIAELFMAVSTVEGPPVRYRKVGRPPSRLATRLVNVSDRVANRVEGTGQP